MLALRTVSRDLKTVVLVVEWGFWMQHGVCAGGLGGWAGWENYDNMSDVPYCQKRLGRLLYAGRGVRRRFNYPEGEFKPSYARVDTRP